MSTMEFNSQLASLQDNLTYFAQSLTQNADDARDLVQETYLKALTYRDKFEANTNLKAWTYTIMKNTFINNYRRNVKMSTKFDNTNDLIYLNSGSASEEATPDSILSHKEISEVVSKLEDEHRIPFQMHHQGYKYKEIAEHLELSESQVKSRLNKAREKLKQLLN